MPSERCYLYERHVSIPSEFQELFAALVIHGEFLAGEELPWRAAGPASVYMPNAALRKSLPPKSSVLTFSSSQSIPRCILPPPPLPSGSYSERLSKHLKHKALSPLVVCENLLF